MTFARANGPGWGLFEELTSAQANIMDLNQSRAVDGFAGGKYTPSAPLEMMGESLLIPDVQATNWRLKTVLQSAVASGNPGYGICSTANPSIVVVGGIAANGSDPHIQVSFDGGESFLNASISNQNLQAGLLTCASLVNIVIAGGVTAGGGVGGQNIYRSTDGGGVWNGNIALPGTAGAGFSIYHMITHGSLFVAVGNDGAGTVAAYCATSPDGASGNWTQRTLPGGSGARIALKAVSNGSRLVIFGSDNGGAATIGWYSDNNGASFSNFTPPANFILGAVYSPEEQLFMALGRSGNDATVYTSADGITWSSSLKTLLFAGSPTNPQNTGGSRIAVYRSLWMVAPMVVLSGVPSRIYWSTNRGVQWGLTFVGPTNYRMFGVHFMPHIAAGFGGRFLLTESFDSAGNISMNYRAGLSFGRTPQF